MSDSIKQIVLIVAMDRQNTIGREGDMPWRLPADLKHFKRVTMGHAIVMGRKTFESIGRPLPGRQNIVVTRNPGFQKPGVTVRDSLDAAFSAAESQVVMVIGGGEIYRQAISHAERLIVTHVNADVGDGDTFFPEIDEKRWQMIGSCDYPSDESNAYDLRFAEYRPRSEAIDLNGPEFLFQSQSR